MKKIAAALTMIALAITLSTAARGQMENARSKRPGNAEINEKAKGRKLAILPFVEQSNRQLPRGGARTVQDVFVTEIVKSAKFRVVEREQLAALMKGKNLTLSGDVDPQTAVKAGKLLNVNYLLTGAVTEYGMTNKNAPRGAQGNVSLRVKTRLIDTSTGEIVWADEVRAEQTATNVSVGGFGGGVDDDRLFNRLAKDCAQQVAAKLKSARL
jgi:curli biogenesis system outer membrane secretion channel CsgG